jgi:hypothetical protein
MPLLLPSKPQRTSFAPDGQEHQPPLLWDLASVFSCEA